MTQQEKAASGLIVRGTASRKGRYLSVSPKDGVMKKYSATGKLTLHGTTKDVTIPLTARRTDSVIAVQGITTVNFDDYRIGDAAGGPASSVDRSGEIEFVVQFQPA